MFCPSRCFFILFPPLFRVSDGMDKMIMRMKTGVTRYSPYPPVRFETLYVSQNLKALWIVSDDEGKHYFRIKAERVIY